MPSDLEAAFFDRIRDEPGDDGPRLIYADWLDENGEPERAEYIRLQCALYHLADDDPRRADIRERERVLGDQFREAWKEKLAPFVADSEFRRGVIDSVSVDVHQFLESGSAIFELAPVRKVRLLNVGERMAKLAQSPLLRLIRELDLSVNELGNRGPALLARSPHLLKLDALNLSFTELGDKGLQAIVGSPTFGTLRYLQVSGNTRLGELGLRALAETPHLTELKELDVSDCFLSDPSLRTILDSPLGARLFKIELVNNRLGDQGTASLAKSQVFQRMAERDGVIDLRHVEMGPAGARALAESPALQFVETLDLEDNSLGDAGVAALASSPHWKVLRVLSLRENHIGDEGIRALARSPLMATLRALDLKGNIITQDSVDRLHETSVGYDWRGLLQLNVDSQLPPRRQYGLLANFVRRPPS